MKQTCHPSTLAKTFFPLALLLALVSAACGLPALAASPTQAAPASLPAPTNTLPVAPTATFQAPTLEATTPAALTLQVFLIAMQDNGASGPAVGCGDSAVAVQVSVPYTQALLRAAMEHLLSIKDQYYGQSGLYNALYQSTLSVDTVRLDGRTAVVELSGQLTMGGECDIPRVEAQLTQTALQFSTVDQAKIFINGKPLKEVLSLK